jgi:hypothetical protein
MEETSFDDIHCVTYPVTDSDLKGVEPMGFIAQFDEWLQLRKKRSQHKAPGVTTNPYQLPTSISTTAMETSIGPFTHKKQRYV